MLFWTERILFYEHDTGRFIGKIDRLGKGHNEYLSIDDFIVRDSLVYVLSAMQYAILVYDVYGHPIKEIELDAFYKHLTFGMNIEYFCLLTLVMTLIITSCYLICERGLF